MKKTALLEAQALKAYYSTRQGYIQAVDNIDLTLDRDVTLGLAGESGCGKSTLMNTLMMNVKPPLHLMEGTIVLDGKVYISNEKKLLWVLKAGREKEVISRCRLKSVAITPVVHDGIFYLPTQRRLFAIKLN